MGVVNEQLYDNLTYRASGDGSTWVNHSNYGPQVHRSFYKSTGGTGKRVKPFPLDQTSYSAEIVKKRMPHGVSKTYEPPSIYPHGIWEEWSGPFAGEYPYGWNPPSVKSQLVNEALIDALKQLKDQKFNAGVAIAEAEGLSRMLMQAGTGYLRTREKFMDKDLKGAYQTFRNAFDSMSWESFKETWGSSLSRAERLKSVPQSWLYYHFGIKPTINDMDGALNEWLMRHNSKPENFTSVVRGQSRHTTHRTEDEYFGIVLRAHGLSLEVQESVQIRLEVQLRDAFAAKMSSLGATNVPEALWNRGPWTWAVDYLVSFGDWLSVLDAGTGYSFGICTQSHRVRYKAKCDYFTRKGQHADVSPYLYRRLVLDREVLNGVIPPTWRVIPKLKLKDVSNGKIANLLSALVSSFGGRGR